MRINGIQSCLNCNSNKSQHTFKGREANLLAQKLPVINNELEYNQLYNRFIDSVFNEPTLSVVNKRLFDELMQFRGSMADAFGAFFYDNGYNKTGSKYVDLAHDASGQFLSYVKTGEGDSIRINTDNGPIEFGHTNDDGFKFLNTKDYYVDLYNVPGYDDVFHVRQVRTKALGGWDTHYYDINGNSNIVTDVKGFLSGLKGLFS